MHESYFTLVREFPLLITSEKELDQAISLTDDLLNQEVLDEGENAYLEALSDLIWAYEKQNHPIDPMWSEYDGIRFLPMPDLAEVLLCDHRQNLLIAIQVDPERRTLKVWRGNMSTVSVPFSFFNTSGDGTEPDFEDYCITDCGHTVRLGMYEAATDCILGESQ